MEEMRGPAPRGVLRSLRTYRREHKRRLLVGNLDEELLHRRAGRVPDSTLHLIFDATFFRPAARWYFNLYLNLFNSMVALNFL
jgi:hypothetical protein